ncbi:MAG: ribonuclease P protein component [Bacteroidetes bacterium]|nr:ribonuclease P protein component [Bacteroidota bacterium]
MTPPQFQQRYKLPRKQILRSQKAITVLFRPGFFVSSYPLRMNYLIQSKTNEAPAVQVMFSVSKKRFKKATDRNRVNRLLREVYRLNQHQLQGLSLPEDQQLAMALIYTGQEILSFQVLKASFLQCIQKLERKMNHA